MNLLLQDLHSCKLNCIAQLRRLKSILGMLPRCLYIFAASVVPRTQQVNNISQIQHSITIRVKLFNEHVTVRLANDKIVLPKKSTQVQRVQLHPAINVDPLENAQQ